MSDTARLLEVLRDAAIRHDDLAAALHGCGVPGAEPVAARLRAGATLPEAVAGVIPARLATLLAGATPPLATVCALLADEAWRAAERRRLIADHLAYPLASVVMVGVMAIVVARVLPTGGSYGHIASAGWALVPAALAVVMMAAPWAPRRWHLPGSAWAAHLDLAGTWSRAALAVQWRLTEAQALALLGADLSGMTAVLGLPESEGHCRMLAEWHQRAARRRLALTAYGTAALILATGGGIVLGAARMWMAAPA